MAVAPILSWLAILDPNRSRHGSPLKSTFEISQDLLTDPYPYCVFFLIDPYVPILPILPYS
jgi:hypothetical protein